MSLWLVLPMNSLLEGKTRLAAVLDLAQRRALLEQMFEHTLNQAAQFPGLDRTLVVSGCEFTRARAAARGAQILAEAPGAGLNGALHQTRLALRLRGATQMMIVHCDLPVLVPDDLRQLARAGQSSRIAIAPDRKREGTNGLCIETPMDFRFSFGPDSFTRHLEQAKTVGLNATLVQSPGLGFDVDLPEDLRHLDNLNPERYASITS
jgi:2-phospho-L-lactate/phosphoenolpyruvate guanylyltransferase